MVKKRVAVMISGRGSNLAALVKACTAVEYPAKIVLVIANRPEAGGLEFASANAIPAVVVDHHEFTDRAAHEKEIARHLAAHRVELICLAGYMRILSQGFVQQWPDKILNIHPSLLPEFPGLHTHQRVLDAGHTEHGCTVHYVNEVLDGGAVIMQAKLPVLPGDTATSLAARVLKLEHKLYPQALARVAAAD